MTVTCQHTGVQFEARSKAAKNHPEVSAILASLDRTAYGPMMEALAEFKSMNGLPTLEEFRALAEQASEVGRGRRERINTERRARYAEWQERNMPGAFRQDEEDADRAAHAEVNARIGQSFPGPDPMEND